MQTASPLRSPTCRYSVRACSSNSIASAQAREPLRRRRDKQRSRKLPSAWSRTPTMANRPWLRSGASFGMPVGRGSGDPQGNGVHLPPVTAVSAPLQKVEQAIGQPRRHRRWRRGLAACLTRARTLACSASNQALALLASRFRFAFALALHGGLAPTVDGGLRGRIPPLPTGRSRASTIGLSRLIR